MRVGLCESNDRWEDIVGAQKLLHFGFKRTSRAMTESVTQSDNAKLQHDD